MLRRRHYLPFNRFVPSTMTIPLQLPCWPMRKDEQYTPPFIRRLMPHASEQEIEQAAENLRAYLKVLYEVFLEREAKARDSRRSESHDRFGNDDFRSSNV